MTNPRTSDGSELARPAAGGRVPLLDRVFDFLVKQFSRQPPWLRAFVYFLFVMFFISTASRLIGGRYAVKGVVWNGDQYAQGCEVRLNGEFFSTNSRGEYHAIFTPTQYYSLLLQRSMRLPIVSAGRRDHAYRVTLNILEDQLGDITLGQDFADGSDGSFSFELIPSVYAQAPTSVRNNDRVYVDKLSFSEQAKDVHYVELQMGLKGQVNPQIQNLGEEAGRLPIKGPGAISLPQLAYYFDVSRRFRGQVVTVEVNGSAGFFKNFHETFTFTMPVRSSTLQVKGNRGGMLQLRVASN